MPDRAGLDMLRLTELRAEVERLAAHDTDALAGWWQVSEEAARQATYWTYS